MDMGPHCPQHIMYISFCLDSQKVDLLLEKTRKILTRPRLDDRVQGKALIKEDIEVKGRYPKKLKAVRFEE
jgi:hypothetical protein